MTDSNTPQSSSPVTPPTSYVDDYQPPQGGAAAPVKAQPRPTKAPAGQKSDPLAELDRLLQEHKARKKSAAPSPKASKPAQKHSSQQPHPKKKKKKFHQPKKGQAPQGSRPNKHSNKRPNQASRSEETQKALKALEEALRQYEVNKGKKGASSPRNQGQPQKPPQNRPNQVQQPKPGGSQKSRDPLAELEILLKEMRTEQNKQAGQKKPRSKPAPPSRKSPPPQSAAPTPPQPKQPKFERVASTPKPQPQPQVAQPAPVVPPSSTPAVEPAAPPASPRSGGEQVIEEQNIFTLLGVQDASEQEREAFLDELQEAIWEDFLEKDLKLLVTPEELQEVQQLRQPVQKTPEQQEAIISKVEALVPDVEELMLEKALELKEEMVRERVQGMKQYYAGKAEAIQKIEEAEQHLQQGHWRTGVEILNTLI